MTTTLYVTLVFVVSVTVRVHLVQFKLNANQTRTLASTQRILQMGPQIWNNVPQDLYAQFLAELVHVHDSRQDSNDPHWRATVINLLLHRHNM